jgi:hypothetical protein
MPDAGTVPPPFLLSLGVCDHIHRDPTTGKRTFLGCLSTIPLEFFPAMYPAMSIYLDLANGRGKVSVRVQIIDSDEERDPVWTTEFELEFPDPRTLVEIDVAAGSVTFPEPGEYRIQVFAGGQFISERGLVINSMEMN